MFHTNPLILVVLKQLLFIHLFWSDLMFLLFQIDCGLRCLAEVLKELKKQQKQSKSWYLLRARTLQTCSSFLSVDAALLPQVQKNLLIEQG